MQRTTYHSSPAWSRAVEIKSIADCCTTQTQTHENEHTHKQTHAPMLACSAEQRIVHKTCTIEVITDADLQQLYSHNITHPPTRPPTHTHRDIYREIYIL